MRKLKPQRWPGKPELEPRSRRGLVEDSIPESGTTEESKEESDSDGPILYRDDNDDDDEGPPSKLSVI